MLIRRSFGLAAAWIWGSSLLLAQDFNQDGQADLLWQNKATGENKLWIKGPIRGFITFSEVKLPGNRETQWRMAGTGKFNGDSSIDILWENQATGGLAVWLMDRTALIGGELIQRVPDPGWRVRVAGDLDGDGHTDIVLEHEETGQKNVWFMEGTAFRAESVIDATTGLNWYITAAADFNRDGRTDLVLQNRIDGSLAIWLMDGNRIAKGTLVLDSLGTRMRVADPDYMVVSAGDYDGDGEPDLFWRQVTLGLNALWLMKGVTYQRSISLTSVFDTDWRVATQEWAESRRRVAPVYGSQVTARVGGTPPQIELDLNLPADGMSALRVQRRVDWETDWAPAVTVPAAMFVDTNVTAGGMYEYEISLTSSSAKDAVLANNTLPSKVRVSVGVELPPIEERGRLLLLVDRSLAGEFPSEMNRTLDLLEADLIGDGWRVARHYVPRHDDAATEEASENNRLNLANIKALIHVEHQSEGVDGILIFGHVTIPYSGDFGPDGHGAHHGAWPADPYYGDLDGVWTDELTYVGNRFLLPANRNVAGDGKFDQNFLPSDLELFVGRVDFARLVLFGTGDEPTAAEMALLTQYVGKAHRYRHKVDPYPYPDRGITYSFFGRVREPIAVDKFVYENAKRNVAAFYADGLEALVVGDPLLQPAKPFGWGFLGGYGTSDAINIDFFVARHSSADLRHGLQPQVGFYVLLGSYFGDWNMNDNFMRACLTTREHGLAAMWVSPNPSWDPTSWRFESMALGRHLGAGLLETMNGRPHSSGDMSRVLAILGDPTLRLHTVAPPRGLFADTFGQYARLIWNAGEEGTTYYVYRADSPAGPFERLTPEPLQNGYFLDRARGDGPKTYMVRAVKVQPTGRGSYVNLSQGMFATVE